MDRQKKIEWLKRYGNEIRTKDRLLEEYMDLSTVRLKSYQVDGLPHDSSRGEGLEVFAIRKEQAYRRMIRQLDKCFGIREEIMDVLNGMQLSNEEYASLLFYRYIMRLPWAKVAEEIGKSEAYCKSGMHRTALDLVVVPADCCCCEES